jgi:hypothetical protein
MFTFSVQSSCAPVCHYGTRADKCRLGPIDGLSANDPKRTPTSDGQRLKRAFLFQFQIKIVI